MGKGSSSTLSSRKRGNDLKMHRATAWLRLRKIHASKRTLAHTDTRGTMDEATALLKRLAEVELKRIPDHVCLSPIRNSWDLQLVGFLKNLHRNVPPSPLASYRARETPLT